MRALISLMLLILSIHVFAQNEFNDYFENATLRIDYWHSGDFRFEKIIVNHLNKDKFWAGSIVSLIDTFNYGKYTLSVFDSGKTKLLFKTGYCSLFQEWQTTTSAKKEMKSFEESVRMPFPKHKVIIEIESLGKNGELTKLFDTLFDPSFTKWIEPSAINRPYKINEMMINGPTNEKIDVAILPDGYSKKDAKLLKQDLEMTMKFLFSYSPLKEYKDCFNVRAVIAWSEESGTDDPNRNIYRNTALHTSFNCLESDRYLMTEHYFNLMNIASLVPFDQVVILVNTNKYGGGGIYNYYTCFAAYDRKSAFLLNHEFGHAFAGLADEYSGDVTYEGFYSDSIEPWEPNITNLVNFERKWKPMVTKGVPIPTPLDGYENNIIGAFEGAGYMFKGFYRPQQDCTMRSVSENNFCAVCRKAFVDRINFFCRGK